MFSCQIFEMKILMDLHVLRSPESENHIFRDWSMYVLLCLRVCYHNSKANHRRSFKFNILHLYYMQMLLETFYGDRTKTLCTGAHKRNAIHYGLF